MKRREVTGYDFPKTLNEIPLPSIKPGVLLDVNSGFRTEKPVINTEKCVNCMMCYIVCPEGTIYKDNDKMAVDYDYCKGCGICAHECRPHAIDMVPEGE